MLLLGVSVRMVSDGISIWIRGFKWGSWPSDGPPQCVQALCNLWWARTEQTEERGICLTDQKHLIFFSWTGINVSSISEVFDSDWIIPLVFLAPQIGGLPYIHNYVGQFHKILIYICIPFSFNLIMCLPGYQNLLRLREFTRDAIILWSSFCVKTQTQYSDSQAWINFPSKWRLLWNTHKDALNWVDSGIFSCGK